MKILIGCEESGVVSAAFRVLGHETWSCDLLPTRGDSRFHIHGSLFNEDGSWALGDFDLGIFHPPCTHLSVSGARHFAKKQADGRQQAAITFFMACINAPIPRVAVENPICIMSSLYRKPDQIIQPWMFGHGETKATCLWLKNLPKLVPTNIVEGREQRIWKMGQSPDRAKKRSETYAGIAAAFANQWGNL